MKRHRRLPSLALAPEPEPVDTARIKWTEVIPGSSVPILELTPKIAAIVTPEIAEAWLKKNHPSNRPIAWRSVEAMANDMRSGQWILTHACVAFDGQGNLIDGQHRLSAVVHAGVAVPMFVVSNNDASFHDPIDRGRPRSIATILGVHFRDTACANVLRMLEQGCELNVPITLAETEAILERHRADIEQVARIPGRTKMGGAILAACIWANPCDPKKTADFVAQVSSGEMIGRGDPAFALRNWQMRMPRVRSWLKTLAALNCLRFHLTDVSISNVSTGEAGYRAVCSRRRALRVANTPGPDLVPAGHWQPKPGRHDGGGDE